MSAGPFSDVTAALPCSQVNSVEEMIQLPQVVERNMIVSAGGIRMAGSFDTATACDKLGSLCWTKLATLNSKHGQKPMRKSMDRNLIRRQETKERFPLAAFAPTIRVIKVGHWLSALLLLKPISIR